MIWWSVGLRADSCRSRGKTAFTGRGFADSESELIKSSVELPGTPVWLLSALSPVTLRKKSPSPARRLPAFSGEGTGRSTSRHRRIGLAGGWGMDRMRVMGRMCGGIECVDG